MTTGIHDLATAGRQVREIDVAINYDIIRLFSEGLYKSPHKAVEELVSNSYDAGAKRVHVLLPDPGDDPEPRSPLWVIDDGHGMDGDGFRQLWRVAHSAKADTSVANGRAPIGQFGIGKLAAYVLAHRLTHVSCHGGEILATVMNFKKVTGHQTDSKPVSVSLRKITAEEAKRSLADIHDRDPEAWDLMFGPRCRSSWTAAGLSDFRQLYDRLAKGTLRWVLSTGLPLLADFQIVLDCNRVSSSKERMDPLKTVEVAREIEGIGRVEGKARIYAKPLTGGKSSEMGRSNGFFIRVRRRVINLEDELFGITQPNHAAWARFAMKLDAEGLRNHLLSSREGVRTSEPVRELRGVLQSVFNECRKAYEESLPTAEDIDIAALLSKTPSTQVVEPLLHGVEKLVDTGSPSFYIAPVPKTETDEDAAWMTQFEADASEAPFAGSEFGRCGGLAAAVRYDPRTRRVAMDLQHPFVDKLTHDGRKRDPAKLFGPSEILLEASLHQLGLSASQVFDFLRDRDRILREMAGDAPPTVTEVIRLLELANQDYKALERATGVAFMVLGFEFQAMGGAAPGPDGLLLARLGRRGNGSGDYRIVYDAKQTDKQTVPAGRISITGLDSTRREENADFGFFVAVKYAAEDDPNGRLNRQMKLRAAKRLTLLKVDHLKRLVRLHLKHGVTLSEILTLFEEARTVGEVDQWMDRLERNLSENEVPLALLLHYLEAEKKDVLGKPSVDAVRKVSDELRAFTPERLAARLQAVQTVVGQRWIRVKKSIRVEMHQTPEQIIAKLESELSGAIRQLSA